jgi:hypothetical protein
MKNHPTQGQISELPAENGRLGDSAYLSGRKKTAGERRLRLRVGRIVGAAI